MLNLSDKQSDSLGHSKTVLEPTLLLDFKLLSDVDKGLKIMSLMSNRVINCYFIVGTTHGIYLLQLTGAIEKFEFNNNFICPLTFQQAKEFVDDSGKIRKMTNQLHEKLKSYEQLSKAEESYNLMYLNSSNRFLYCNLMEFQIQCENSKEVIRIRLFMYRNGVYYLLNPKFTTLRSSSIGMTQR